MLIFIFVWDLGFIHLIYIFFLFLVDIWFIFFLFFVINFDWYFFKPGVKPLLWFIWLICFISICLLFLKLIYICIFSWLFWKFCYSYLIDLISIHVLYLLSISSFLFFAVVAVGRRQGALESSRRWDSSSSCGRFIIIMIMIPPRVFVINLSGISWEPGSSWVIGPCAVATFIYLNHLINRKLFL